MKQEEIYNQSPQDTAQAAGDTQPGNERKVFSFLNRERNSRAVSLVKQKLLAEFDPVIRRSEKAVQPVKNWMIGNPIPAFMLMIAIILLNATVGILFTDNKQPDSNSYTGIIRKITKDLKNDTLFNPPANTVQIFGALADLKSIEQIRDSLDLLLLKKHLTAEDSLTFIHLSERLEKIKVR